MTTLPPFFVAVSKLCKFDFCNKTAKILIFDNPKYSKNTNQHYMETGTRQHTKFSEPYKDFERRVFRHALQAAYGRVLCRMFTFYQIRGIPDDFEVFSQLNSKYVSIIELKTTHKRKLTAAETRSSIFQLQLYIWILEPLLEPLGYKIAEEHTLEIRSQQDKHLIQKITVCPTLNMQEKLTFIFDCFRGLEKMSCPPIWVCQTCPKPIKEACDWYKMRKEAKK